MRKQKNLSCKEPICIRCNRKVWEYWNKVSCKICGKTGFCENCIKHEFIGYFDYDYSPIYEYMCLDCYAKIKKEINAYKKFKTLFEEKETQVLDNLRNKFRSLVEENKNENRTRKKIL